MSNLLKFDIKLDDEVKSLDIEKDLNINAQDISNELIQQPAKFAYYGALSEFAHKRVTELDNEIDLLYSQKYKKIIEASQTEEADDKDKKKKPEKLTETAIKNLIINTKSYQEMLSQKANMEYIYNILKVARQAFEQRCNMLIQIGSLSRKEMESAVLQIKKQMTDKIK